MVFNNLEQLNIFDVLDPGRFCQDDSINEIVEKIELEFGKTCLILDEKSYTIWDNDKKGGKRLSMRYFHPDYLPMYTKSRPLRETEALFINELKKVNIDYLIEYSEERNIEISIIWTPFVVLVSTCHLKKVKTKRKHPKLQSLFQEEEIEDEG